MFLTGAEDAKIKASLTEFSEGTERKVWRRTALYTGLSHAPRGMHGEPGTTWGAGQSEQEIFAYSESDKTIL